MKQEEDVGLPGKNNALTLTECYKQEGKSRDQTNFFTFIFKKEYHLAVFVYPPPLNS
jgi:hypothetical protein